MKWLSMCLELPKVICAVIAAIASVENKISGSSQKEDLAVHTIESQWSSVLSSLPGFSSISKADRETIFRLCIKFAVQLLNDLLGKRWGITDEAAILVENALDRIREDAEQ